MPKIQRQYKAGSQYYVEGVSERVRQLVFVGRAEIMGKEYLLFKPARKASKQKP